MLNFIQRQNLRDSSHKLKPQAVLYGGHLTAEDTEFYAESAEFCKSAIAGHLVYIPKRKNTK